ncbi:MAG TPA: PAS domain S-box protein, partial [Terriglobia bacterium]|nr:PAS domain S-box protein [Terriglobia bacterium]
NDAAVEHYGYSREEFLGMKATVLQPDDDQETFRERLRRLQSSRGIAAQRRHRTKDGHLINVEVSFQTIDFGGRKASLTIAQDVTERIRAEAENMRLAAAIQQSVEAIIITDAAGTIQFVNPAFSQITGYSAGEALGQNPRILKSGKQDPALYEDLWSTILGGRTWRGEIVNRRKNGTLYSEEMTITPVRDVSGTVTNFVAIKQDLTHHKRAAEALTASEKRYRQLFERNAAGVFATTLDGRILNCNQAAAEMFGYHSPSEVPHLRVVDLHSSSDPRPVLERLRLEKSLTNCELQLMRSDGTPVWAIGNLNLVEGGNGQPGIVETILVDITERKRAEEALRQNEQSFHLLFSDNPLPMWVYDVRNLRFLEVNTAAVAHYGYSRDEFLGMRIADIRPEDDLPLLDHSLHMERPDLEESGPWRHRLRDGRIIDVQIISHPMMWHGVSAVLVVAQDVTDRKRAEEALRQSEARYRLLFERNLAGVFQAEAGGRLTDCNDACAHMLGYASREEMVNIPLGDLALDSEAALAASECLAEQKALTNFEIALKGQNGEPVWVIANVSVVQNCGTHYEGTVIDVTARKRAEEALRSRTVELERSNADLEQFAYVASHDLQEPLRMVANFTQLLRERYEGRLDQDADEFIGFAVEGATRMQNLIAGLLSYARVKSRARELESADSEAVLGRCLTTLRAAIRESEAQVTHDPLPAVLADDLQLEHVFQNLVSNALKFRGSDPPQVHISAERNGAQWVFSVKDNGIGIDPRFYERIFVIFQRLHTRQAYPGTGIGLSICKRIVERHGGRIWVESEEGKGATFYFTMSAVPEGDRRASGELLQLTA